MNILKVAVNNKQELVKLYIPQFKAGGVFIKGKFNYELGMELFILVTLPDGENLAINGRVCWLSPDSAVSYPAGIGIEFNSDKAGMEAKSRIEIMLGGLLQNVPNSYTF